MTGRFIYGGIPGQSKSFRTHRPTVRAYRLAYDGQPYHGFQRQPDVSTVEGQLFSALAALGVVATEADKPPAYAAAGRTDAGVSARAQTIAFEAPDWLDPAAFNSELPPSIRVWAHASVDPDFHARHHATRREYTYFLHSRGLSQARAREAMERLAGEHDFHNLTPEETGTRRTLEMSLAVEEAGTFFQITVAAGGFARQLVRRLVTLVECVASGQRPPAFVDRVLSDESLDGPDGIGPALAAGLVLTDVVYPGVTFTVDEVALESASQCFRGLHEQRAVQARVAAALSAVGNGTE